MAGAPPQTPLGSLQRSPRPPSRLRGDRRVGASILVPSALASVLPSHLYVRGAASADSSRTCSESRVFSLAILPERHVHVSKNLTSILVTISISASWFFGQFNCRRVGLSASCPVTVNFTLQLQTTPNQTVQTMYIIIIHKLLKFI